MIQFHLGRVYNLQLSQNVLTTYPSTWSKTRAAHAELLCARHMCYDKTKAAGKSAEKTCPLSGDPKIHTSQSVWYNYWTSAHKNSDVKKQTTSASF